jgi:hypothetical protein
MYVSARTAADKERIIPQVTKRRVNLAGDFILHLEMPKRQ